MTLSELLQATIETMKNRAEEARVQEAGLVALEHVITKSHSNVTEGILAVGAAGGLHASLDAIRHHADNYQIALQASRATLSILSPHEKLGALLLVSTHLKSAPAHPLEATIRHGKRPLMHAHTLVSAAQGCIVLALLLQSAPLADTAGKMGAASALVALMGAHKQAALQEKASWALMNLGAQVHDNKSRIHDEGGVEALIAGMKRLPGHAGVQRQARSAGGRTRTPQRAARAAGMCSSAEAPS